jgi:hypothetical protein
MELAGKLIPKETTIAQSMAQGARRGNSVTPRGRLIGISREMPRLFPGDPIGN